MKPKNACGLVAGMILTAGLANAGSLTYICDPSVATATCNYLNTTVAGYYDNTFSDANATIYITYGTAELGQSNSYNNDVSYSDYVAALTANAHKDSIQASALAGLDGYDAGPYGAGDVDVTPALGAALGFSGMIGTTIIGTPCPLPSTGCYDGVITITDDPGTHLYYDNLGGTESSDAYDYYAVVQHETDEVLGTASCISTQSMFMLTNDCDSAGEPSAADLYRYASATVLVPDSSFSTTPGAYFSFDFGISNGANGFVYNTLDNGEDYADFVSSCPGGPFSIQDAEGCQGTGQGMTILNDGGAEVNILNVVGYDRVVAPEPSTLSLLSFGLGASVLCLSRKRSLRDYCSLSVKAVFRCLYRLD